MYTGWVLVLVEAMWQFCLTYPPLVFRPCLSWHIFLSISQPSQPWSLKRTRIHLNWTDDPILPNMLNTAIEWNFRFEPVATMALRILQKYLEDDGGNPRRLYEPSSPRIATEICFAILQPSLTKPRQWLFTGHISLCQSTVDPHRHGEALTS